MTRSTEDERKDYRSRVIEATRDFLSGKRPERQDATKARKSHRNNDLFSMTKRPKGSYRADE